MAFSVYFVICFLISIVITQNVEEAQTTSGNICAVCHCATGVLNCNSRQLTAMFESQSWDAVRSLQFTEVDFSNNQLSKMTIFPELPIQTLNLSNCHIDRFEHGAFMHLSNLSVIDLSWNRITTSALHRWVFVSLQKQTAASLVTASFFKTKQLSLAHNDIHSLAQDLFRFMPDLEQLDLSGNPLVSMDQVTMGAITDLVKLKELRLSSCELESLPEGLLRRQRRLEYLDLSDNRFTIVPTVLGEATNLVSLNFDKNPLEILETTTSFSKLTKLQELRLCRLSKLQSIAAGALGGLQHLVILRVSDNPRLSSLDPSFLKWEDDQGEERWPLLKELYLNNNNLSEINPHLLDRWDQLTDVDFTNNPYLCECSNQWMVNVLVPTIMATAAKENAGNMVCYKPLELRGMRFATLYESSTRLPCAATESEKMGTAVPKTAIILGIMIGIFVTFPIVLILVLLWKKGSFTRCRGKPDDTNEEDDEETDAF